MQQTNNTEDKSLLYGVLVTYALLMFVMLIVISHICR
jgi:hypothetical protein